MVDRKYFEEIGLLDEGMEIYGGENVELGIRVSGSIDLDQSHGKHMMKLIIICHRRLLALPSLYE